MDEMARAIAGLKDGKTPGGDGIPAEVWKHGGDNLLSRLHRYFGLAALFVANVCYFNGVTRTCSSFIVMS